MQSTIIRNGKIIDGTGKRMYTGHVLLKGDRIQKIIENGESLPAADTILEAEGLCVAPGFIDMHSHADWHFPQINHPELLQCLPEQGVTTLVCGNCGFSPTPFNAERLARFGADPSAVLTDTPLDFKWNTMGEYLDCVEAAAPILNMAELVGHTAIKIFSSDTVRGRMNAVELKRCLSTLRSAFEEGACGLSFGLGYDPGMYSPLEELESFCQVAAEYDRPVTVHLKALSRISPTYPLWYPKPHNLRAIREMLSIGHHTGIKLQLSHFIFVGRNSWSTADRGLDLVETARQKGLDVRIDAFPYTCGNTTINVVLPYWFLKTLPDGYRRRRALARLRVELEVGFKLLGFHYQDLQIMDAVIPEWRNINGLRLTAAAEKWNMSPFQTMLRISEQTKGAALMLLHTYSGEPGNETVIERVLSHDACLFETDALFRGQGYPNPAAMGTFPKILGDYVRKRGLFSLEDAIHRMTGASAERFGLKGRGVLASGNAADIVVFNPQTISDQWSDNARPAGQPEGIAHVFINGKQVVSSGNYMDSERAGSVLRV